MDSRLQSRCVEVQAVCVTGCDRAQVYNTDSMTPVEEEIIKKEILIMEALEHENIVTYIGVCVCGRGCLCARALTITVRSRLLDARPDQALHGVVHAHTKRRHTRKTGMS
jgi:hypothetical protein